MGNIGGEHDEAGRSTYRDLAEAASIAMGRYSQSEVRFRSTVQVVQIQRRADAVAKGCRDMDATNQELSWWTDRIE